MKVFVTGASGFIGAAVARAFARSGHDVRGLARTQEKARALAASEIEPVIGSMDEPQGWLAAAGACDVLVHCAAESSKRAMDLDRQTITNLVSAATSARAPRLLLYTSGVWVYGNTGDAAADENSALQPPALVARRPEHERAVLDASSGALRTIVLRPGCVFGGSGSLTGLWFESALNSGAARFVGDGNARWAMVHLEDLAELYVRCGESGLAREIFNATDGERSSVRACAQAASTAAGCGGRVESVPVEQAAQQFGRMAECLALDQHVSSSKAQRMLGWRARQRGFVAGAARSFAAWRAARGA